MGERWTGGVGDSVGSCIHFIRQTLYSLASAMRLLPEVVPPVNHHLKLEPVELVLHWFHVRTLIGEVADFKSSYSELWFYQDLMTQLLFPELVPPIDNHLKLNSYRAINRSRCSKCAERRRSFSSCPASRVNPAINPLPTTTRAYARYGRGWGGGTVDR